MSRRARPVRAASRLALRVPAIGYRWLNWNPIFAFWFAYVITRPLGASFADWLGKPASLSALGLGNGRVALVLTAAIACLVGYLAVTRRDVQSRRAHAHEAPLRR